MELYEQSKSKAAELRIVAERLNSFIGEEKKKTNFHVETRGKAVTKAYVG